MKGNLFHVSHAAMSGIFSVIKTLVKTLMLGSFLICRYYECAEYFYATSFFSL